MKRMQSLRADKSFIKEMNTTQILRVVRQNMPISRAEISRMTGLTPATVSSNLIPLLEREIIRETGAGLSSGGRKPTLLELNPQAMFSLGIDVGPSRIKAAFIDLAGNVYPNSITTKAIPTDHIQVLDQIIQIITDMVERIDDHNVLGIGIGMHGLVNSTTGVSLYAPAFKLKNVPLKKLLEEKFTKRVCVDNDVRAMALGEKWFGNAKQSDHFIFLNVGTSIGSAIYSHDRMVEGAMNSAGEIGHIFIRDNSIRCFCGKTGCLSTVAAGPALEQEAMRLLRQGAPSSLQRYLRQDGRIKGEWIHQAAREGDVLAKNILCQASRDMGKVLAAAVNILNPERIVLGGGVAKAADILIPKMLETIKLYAMDQHTERIRIEPTSLGDHGGVIGSATLVLEAFFDQPVEFLKKE